MVGHAIYRDECLSLTGNDTGDVFLQFLFAFGIDHTGPSGNGEHDVQIDLRVGVCHWQLHVAPTELAKCVSMEGYKHGAPTELGLVYGGSSQEPLRWTCDVVNVSAMNMSLLRSLRDPAWYECYRHGAPTELGVAYGRLSPRTASVDATWFM